MNVMPLSSTRLRQCRCPIRSRDDCMLKPQHAQSIVDRDTHGWRPTADRVREASDDFLIAVKKSSAGKQDA